MRTRVLIAEDDADLRELLAQLLGARGHRVEVAVDGAECVERARTFLPHVVVIDLQMPRMDGVEAIRQLRASAELADAAVIVITGHAELARGQGGDGLWDDLLTKPAGPMDIADAIEGAIHARQTRLLASCA